MESSASIGLLPRWVVLCAALALAACGGSRERPGVPPRNAVWITVQGLRADRMSVYGCPVPTTASIDGEPSIDRLADEGVLFLSLRGSQSAEPVDGKDGGDVNAGLDPQLFSQAFAAALAASEFDAALFASADSLASIERLSSAVAGGSPRSFPTVDAEASEGDSEAVVRRALDWLASRADPTRPFFLWLHLSGLEGTLEPRKYDAAVRALNDQVSAFVSGLASGGVLQSSALALVGVGDVPPIPSGIGMPLLLRHPASLTGRRVFSSPVALADLAPTFADWLGLAGGGATTGWLPAIDGWRDFPALEQDLGDASSTGVK